jgi:catalase
MFIAMNRFRVMRRGLNRKNFAKGAVTIGRYQLLPDAGRHFLSKDESAKAAADYLEDEIRQRVARGAVRFNVVLQLAAPGDKIEDPSVSWASTNKITTLGTLIVASVVPDSEATERALLFLPALRLDAELDHRVRGFDAGTPVSLVRLRFATT